VGAHGVTHHSSQGPHSQVSVRQDGWDVWGNGWVAIELVCGWGRGEGEGKHGCVGESGV
jgi:hypothetical protein